MNEKKDEKVIDDLSRGFEPWPVISREKKYQNPWITLWEEDTVLPNKKRFTFTVIDAPNWVSILPVRGDGKLVMIEQYRPPWKSLSLEFPAGRMEKGENPVDAAQRELREEIGCSSKNLIHVHTLRPITWTTQWVHFYVALDLEESPLPPDSTEFLSKKILSEEEFLQLFSEGKIVDLPTVTAYFLAKNKELI